MEENNKSKSLIWFNDAFEYLDKYNTQEILEESINRFNNQINNGNYLRNAMLDELNNLRTIISDGLDLEVEALSKKEKEIFYDFIDYYNECPICGTLNHIFNLKQFFFDDKKHILREELIRLMCLKNKKLKRYNLNLGVACCNCYKKVIME